MLGLTALVAGDTVRTGTICATAFRGSAGTVVNLSPCDGAVGSAVCVEIAGEMACAGPVDSAARSKCAVINSTSRATPARRIVRKAVSSVFRERSVPSFADSIP